MADRNLDMSVSSQSSLCSNVTVQERHFYSERAEQDVSSFSSLEQLLPDSVSEQTLMSPLPVSISLSRTDHILVSVSSSDLHVVSDAACSSKRVGSGSSDQHTNKTSSACSADRPESKSCRVQHTGSDHMAELVTPSTSLSFTASSTSVSDERSLKAYTNAELMRARITLFYH
jgi:hypothetical protein